MIGAGRGPGRAQGWLAIGLLGVALGLRPAAAAAADPPLAAARAGAVAVAAGQAMAALDALAAIIDTARDAARSGSALIVDGNDPPGPPLIAAADALETSSATVADADAAVARLSGILAAVNPAEAGPALGIGPAELPDIGAQLREAAPAATTFVGLRHAAQATLTELGAALAALTADNPESALAALGRARTARDLLGTWQSPPPELAVWLDTTGSMLEAAQRIADAVAAGDQTAADAAGRAYAAAAQQAAEADRALELSIAETGSAITLPALQRLALADDSVMSARSWIAAVGE
jgi:hypothetical protein